MLSEFLKPEEKRDVLKSRLENQKRQIEEAEANLAEAEGDAKTLWEHRIAQYKEELQRIESELESEDEEIAA